MIERDIFIGGKTYHVRFSYRAALMFEDLQRQYEGQRVDSPTMLFFVAMVAGETYKERTFDLSYAEFLDWLDNFPQIRMEILTLTTEYMMNIAGGEKKKK